MPRTHDASRLVTIGCFCDLSTFKLTPSSNPDNSWDTLVTKGYKG